MHTHAAEDHSWTVGTVAARRPKATLGLGRKAPPDAFHEAVRGSYQDPRLQRLHLK